MLGQLGPLAQYHVEVESLPEADLSQLLPHLEVLLAKLLKKANDAMKRHAPWIA